MIFHNMESDFTDASDSSTLRNQPKGPYQKEDSRMYMICQIASLYLTYCHSITEKLTEL